MARVLFTLQSLAQHWREGLAERMFAREFAKVMLDVKSAPDIKKARRITINVDIIPGTLQDGGLDEVSVGVQVTSKTPPRQAAGVMVVGLGQNQTLVFEADLPDSDPRQRPLFEGNSVADDGGNRPLG